MKDTPIKNYVEKAISILEIAREQVVKSVNQAMVFAYFKIGEIIVEEEQSGKKRAEYSKQTIKKLSEKLEVEYGRGFSIRNLEQMRKFYLTYSKAQTSSAELSFFLQNI